MMTASGRTPLAVTKQLWEIIPMTHDFKVGDHVEWNSEAGRVRGTIKKKIISEITFKGYTVHASKEEPRDRQQRGGDSSGFIQAFGSRPSVRDD
jgi:Hypervirulence associated proteins TUDOR domain